MYRRVVLVGMIGSRPARFLPHIELWFLNYVALKNQLYFGQGGGGYIGRPIRPLPITNVF